MGGRRFNFKIRIVQTNIASREYLLARGIGGISSFAGDPAMYQNSNYISKLHFINNYSGGILAKDKIEDMPERYRRFVRFGDPSDAQMLKNFKKEMSMLANREEVGQNVFYSRLSSQAEGEARPKEAKTPEYAEAAINFDAFCEAALSGEADFAQLAKDYLSEFAQDFEDGEEYEEEYDEEYEDYEDDEEIRDILHLNNVFNSEMFKMSKVEYDFNASGTIDLGGDGLYDIRYDEDEMTGVEGSYIRILFKADNRDIVTVHRKNFFDSWFTLEKGKRVSIERSDGHFNAVTSTNTKELANSLGLEGGSFRAAYTTETNGVPTEIVTYSIKAEPTAGN